MAKKNRVSFIDNLKAIRTANQVRVLVTKFNKDFLSIMKDTDVDTKLNMYRLCIKYMNETLNKRFK